MTLYRNVVACCCNTKVRSTNRVRIAIEGVVEVKEPAASRMDYCGRVEIDAYLSVMVLQ